VRTSTAIADPSNPGNVITPNADGSVNVRIVGMIVTQQTGTTYTFTLADANTYVQMSNGSAIAATIPTNTSVAFPIGTIITVEQDGAGVVTMTAAGGVTFHSPSAKVATNGQYAQVVATKVATNTWVLSGNLN
jgi:hypothetical protein